MGRNETRDGVETETGTDCGAGAETGTGAGAETGSRRSAHGLSVPDGVATVAWEALARVESRVRNGRREHRFAIDERNEHGEIIGTTLRDAKGTKTCVPGGRRGLILAWPLHPYAGSKEGDPVIVCEGASDTASLMTLGFDAVGVPMAGHGGEMLASLLAGKHVALMPDNDEAGRGGMDRVAASLAGRVLSLRVVSPPLGAKDAREAVIKGATREDVEEGLGRTALESGATTSAAPTDAAPRSGISLVRLCDVQPQPIEWLWPGRVALGKLTLLAGDPGLGKSFVTLDMASRVSTGRAWPGAIVHEAGEHARGPASVVLLSAEDDPADTIRPRLDAMEADVTRIACLRSDRGMDLATDLPAIEHAMDELADCRLVVIDPISAYLASVDSHKNSDVRSVLAPLASLAQRHKAAVVVVTHLNKAAGTPAMYRASGSLAFAAAARSAWLMCKDKEDPERRLLLPIKNNLASDRVGGLAFCVQHGRVAWEHEGVVLSAEEAMREEAGGKARPRDKAGAWLRARLANGPVELTTLFADGEREGISRATLYRAREELGVVTEHQGTKALWHTR